MTVKGTVARHPAPPMGTENCVEVSVDLSEHGLDGQTEMLWATAAHEHDYVVACIPFFAYGIQFGDLIEVDPASNKLVRVLQQSGLRTMRVAFVNEAVERDMHDSCREHLSQTPLPHEWCDSGYVSILVRNNDDQKLGLSAFRSQIDAHQVEWEVDPEPFE